MNKAVTFFFVAFLLGSLSAIASPPTRVMVMEIKGQIDARTSRYVGLALDHSEEIDADIIVVDMDTFGGVLTDAKDIVNKILRLSIPIWVFVDKDAASAGALISIACDSIYMAPGSSLGAATVVNQQGQAAPDKYQSYMRAIMRATAEENGRDPAIAEGMVDEDLVVEGLSKEGEIITLTPSEALKHGYCEAQASSIEAILKRNHVEEYTLIPFELTATEKVIAFFVNPFISGFLILLILGGIYFELQSPGIGFPLAAAAVALLLYLMPYYLNGLAENWEIIMLFLGLVLLAVEVFVIPGFGIFGISGLALLLLSLVLVMLNNDFFNFEAVPFADITKGLMSVFGSVLAGAVLFFFLGIRFSRTRLFQRASLTVTQDVEKGYSVTLYDEALIGKRGTAHTVLRPGGKVMIDGALYDASSRGDYIAKDESVRVIQIEGNTLKVKKSEA